MTTQGIGKIGKGRNGRRDSVRPGVMLAAVVLLVLGAVKVVAVLQGEGKDWPVSGEQVSQWRQWTLGQGVAEVLAGTTALCLRTTAGSLVLAAVGSGFLVWQFLETPTGVPCPCLAGLRSWSAWVREHEAEWRFSLAAWFFLVGVLSWRSCLGRA